MANNIILIFRVFISVWLLTIIRTAIYNFQNNTENVWISFLNFSQNKYNLANWQVKLNVWLLTLISLCQSLSDKIKAYFVEPHFKIIWYISNLKVSVLLITNKYLKTWIYIFKIKNKSTYKNYSWKQEKIKH